MNKTLKNNRDLLRKKKGFEVLKENASWKKGLKPYRYKKASPQQLEKIQHKMKRQKRLSLLKGAIVFMASTAFVYFIINYLIDLVLV
ncbi:MAG: hypothetical protein R3345_14525 [Fulvivirga sp.]|nr:hypothetical protein [Fulvivirga sp.]